MRSHFVFWLYADKKMFTYIKITFGDTFFSYFTYMLYVAFGPIYCINLFFTVSCQLGSKSLGELGCTWHCKRGFFLIFKSTSSFGCKVKTKLEWFYSGCIPSFSRNGKRERRYFLFLYCFPTQPLCQSTFFTLTSLIFFYNWPCISSHSPRGHFKSGTIRT